MGAGRAGALSSICNTCGSYYADIDGDVFHSPQIFSLAIRRVGSLLLQVGPVREGHGGPAPSATWAWASSSSPPSLSPDQIRPTSTHEKFRFTNVTKISRRFRPAISVGGAGRTLRTWAPEATTSVETFHRHHTSHTHSSTLIWGTFVSGLPYQGRPSHSVA